MNGRTEFWARVARTRRAEHWLVRLRMAQARLRADLRALYGH